MAKVGVTTLRGEEVPQGECQVRGWGSRPRRGISRLCKYVSVEEGGGLGRRGESSLTSMAQSCTPEVLASDHPARAEWHARLGVVMGGKFDILQASGIPVLIFLV